MEIKNILDKLRRLDEDIDGDDPSNFEKFPPLRIGDIDPRNGQKILSAATNGDGTVIRSRFGDIWNVKYGPADVPPKPEPPKPEPPKPEPPKPEPPKPEPPKPEPPKPEPPKPDPVIIDPPKPPRVKKKWPTTRAEIMAFQKGRDDPRVPGQKLVVDGKIGTHTYQALVDDDYEPPKDPDYGVTPYKVKPTPGVKPKPKVGPKSDVWSKPGIDPKTGNYAVKESFGRIAKELMKDMGYDLYEDGAGYGDPFAANQMDYDAQMANGKKNLDWIKKQLGMGQEQPTPEPNIMPPYRPSPPPFVPDPTSLDGEGGDKPRPRPSPPPFVPDPTSLDGEGGDKPRPRPSPPPFVPDPTGLDGAGGDKPTPPPKPAPPKPPVTTQRKNPLFDPRVLAFQKELIKKGAKINPDGVYGKETNKAAEQFGMDPPPGIKTTRDAGGSTPAPKPPVSPGKTDSGKTPPVATQPVTPDGKPPANADKSQPYWVDGNKYKWAYMPRHPEGGRWEIAQKKGEYSLWGGNEANKRSGYTDASNVYTGPDKEPVQTQPHSTQMSTMPPPKVSSVREDAELTAMLRIAGLR